MLYYTHTLSILTSSHSAHYIHSRKKNGQSKVRHQQDRRDRARWRDRDRPRNWLAQEDCKSPCCMLPRVCLCVRSLSSFLTRLLFLSLRLDRAMARMDWRKKSTRTRKTRTTTIMARTTLITERETMMMVTMVMVVITSAESSISLTTHNTSFLLFAYHITPLAGTLDLQPKKGANKPVAIR